MAGQIIPRGKRTWLVRVFIGRHSETGKRQYQSKTIHGNKKEAQRYLTESLRERDMGIVVEPETAGLGRYLDKWLETSVKPRVRSKTHTDYSNLLTRHVRPVLGGRPVAKIRPLEIQAIYQRMQEQGLSARTIRYTHAVLHSAFSQAVRWRMLVQNPADYVDLPRQERKEMQVLTPEQTRMFLEEAKNDRLGTLFALAVTTGLRPSEYLALRWPDMDFGSGTLSVNRSLEWKKDGGWQFQDTKRAGSRRTVKLQNAVCAILRKHQCDQREERAKAEEKGKWQDTALIFTTRHGGPLEERNVAQENFSRILGAIGLAGPKKSATKSEVKRECEADPQADSRKSTIRLYDLRHTAATNALIAGVPPKVVSEMLGHASVAFTLDVYAHVLPHMQEQAAAKVEALLFPTVTPVPQAKQPAPLLAKSLRANHRRVARSDV
jgi:integrase